MKKDFPINWGAWAAISALVNCGGFPQAFRNEELNEAGLVASFERAEEINYLLKAHYPEESHAQCHIWALWKMKKDGGIPVSSRRRWSSKQMGVGRHVAHLFAADCGKWMVHFYVVEGFAILLGAQHSAYLQRLPVRHNFVSRECELFFKGSQKSPRPGGFNGLTSVRWDWSASQAHLHFRRR